MDPHLHYEFVRQRQADILAQVEKDRLAKEALNLRPAQVSKVRRWVGSALVFAGLRLLAVPGDPAFITAQNGWRR